MIPFSLLLSTAKKMFEDGSIGLEEYKKTITALNNKYNRDTLEQINKEGGLNGWL